MVQETAPLFWRIQLKVEGKGLAAYLVMEGLENLESGLNPEDFTSEEELFEYLFAFLKEQGLVKPDELQAKEAARILWAKKEKASHKFLVAEGRKPVNGDDGFLRFLFGQEKRPVPKELEDGRVNYFDLGLIDTVSEGDLLCEIIPPTDGKDGQDVFGEPLKAKPGKAVIPRLGRNVEYTDDGKFVKATRDGQPRVEGKTLLSVVPVYEVKGDVDSSTGNIEFNGSVIISGTVNTGLKVEATEDIEVYGSVEGGSLLAGGDIIVRQGIRGAGRSLVVTNGDLKTTYIENAQVRVEGELIAQTAILHSDVHVRKRVEVLGKNGMIAGGLIRAKNEIACKVLGSHMGTKTTIQVGIDPGIAEEIVTLQKDFVTLEKELDKMQQILALLNKQKEANQELPEEKEELFNRILGSYKDGKERFVQISARLKELKGEYDQRDSGRVVVIETTHAGVKIIVGAYEKNVKVETPGGTWVVQNKEVRLGPATNLIWG